MTGDATRADIFSSHELAHQWFGDSVTPESWQDIWLNEGFATYASWLWLEHSQGPSALADEVQQNYRVIASNRGALPGDPGVGELFGDSRLSAWRPHPARFAPHRRRPHFLPDTPRVGEPVPIQERHDRRNSRLWPAKSPGETCPGSSGPGCTTARFRNCPTFVDKPWRHGNDEGTTTPRR